MAVEYTRATALMTAAMIATIIRPRLGAFSSTTIDTDKASANINAGEVIKKILSNLPKA